MKSKLIIFPFGGNGLEAYDCLTDEFDFIGFVDDNQQKQKKYSHFEVFSREIINKYPETKVLAVVGGPSNYKLRVEIINSLNISNGRFANLVHPGAHLSKLSKIGYNNLIMAGTVVTGFAEIGNHVCILPNTVIHHETKIGDYALIGSNVTIAGGVILGENCYIGSGSSIIQLVKIGEGSLIGMSSNVLSNVAANCKVVGNPARPI